MDCNTKKAQLFLDGNAWCAVGPYFRDLMQDHAGFGETQGDAVAELNEQRRDEKPLEIHDFIVVCPRCNAPNEWGSEPDGCEDFFCPGETMFEEWGYG